MEHSINDVSRVILQFVFSLSNKVINKSSKSLHSITCMVVALDPVNESIWDGLGVWPNIP